MNKVMNLRFIRWGISVSNCQAFIKDSGPWSYLDSYTRGGGTR